MADVVEWGPRGGGDGLGAALAEAAYARLERGLVSVADRIGQLCVGSPADPLEGLSRRIGGMLRMEEAVVEAGVDAGRAGALGRFLHAQWTACSPVREIATSLVVDDLDPRVSQAIAAALAELVAMTDAERAPGPPQSIYVASDWHGAEVVVAFAAEGFADATLRGDAAIRSFYRAERLVRLVGGDLEHGVRDGRLVVGMVVPPGVGRGPVVEA